MKENLDTMSPEDDDDALQRLFGTLTSASPRPKARRGKQGRAAEALSEMQLQRLMQKALIAGMSAALAALTKSLQVTLGSAGVRPQAARAAVRAAIVPALTEVSLNSSLGPDPGTTRKRARRGR